MDGRLWTLGLVLGSALACARGVSGRIEQDPVETHHEPGYTLAVPAGARVVAGTDTLTVDAPDGARWFDLQFLPADADARTTFQVWADKACATHVLDPVESPAPNVITVGGFCTIEQRRHWVIAAVEPWQDRQIATLYVADAARVTIEDAWVDAERTAFTAVPGDRPFEAITSKDVREAARAAQAEGDGPKQTPGGGVLWGRIARRLGPSWTARAEKR